MTDFLDSILLVQEHSHRADAICANLQEVAGQTVLPERAHSIEQAIHVLERQVVLAILLDLDLPGNQGLDGFIMLHLRVPRVPILVFSETVSPELGLAAVRAGAQDCLTRAEVESPLIGRVLGYAIERQKIQAATSSHAEQLQFSEARFRLLINENADAIVVVNPEGIVRFANPASATLYGKAREELTGTVLPLSPDDDGTTFTMTRGDETLYVQARVAETMWKAEYVYLATLRNVTAQQRIKDSQRELALALADSAAALNSTLSPEQVVDRILENVGRVVPHDAVSIFLIHDGLAHFVSGHGFEERGLLDVMQDLRLPVEQIPGFGLMIETGKPLLIPDTRASEDWTDLTGGWIRSYVGAPLRVQTEVLGFLNLDSATPDFFTSQHAQDLEAFADHAAIALDNARLHAEAQQRADQFAILYDMTRELALHRDLDTLLNALLRRAIQLLNTSSGALGLYLAETQELEARVVLVRGEMKQRPPLKVGEGLLGRIALQRQAVVIEDYRTWEHHIERAGPDGVSAVVGVPMMFGGELVGVLAVHEVGDTTRRFTQGDAQLLTLLATQAAAMVHNVRLHAETEKRAQQLGLLYDAGLALNRVLEPEMQLEFLTKIAMRSVHADRAAFFRFDAPTQELALEISVGFGDAGETVYTRRVPLDAPQGVEAWVARERLPATLRDAPKDPRFVVTTDALLSGIWVPVEHDGRFLGVLAVGSVERNHFTPDDERLLILYASQAAIALENVRLYNNEVQANERRAVLHWASQEIISAGLDAERVYGAIHQAASRLMPCEAFVIAVLDDSGEQVELVYLYDRAGRQPYDKVAKGIGLTGHLIERGEALVVDDLAASGIQAYHFGDATRVASILAVPLRHGEQVFGMLSAQTYERGAYDADDRVMLEMLAAHAAAALMNVRGAHTMLDSLERAYMETALALAKTIDARDSYTGAHSDRSALLAEQVARAMLLDDEEAQVVRLGARLHDIGKIGVPDEVLRKPTALTLSEWTLMKRHPEIGAEILALVRPLESVLPVVRHHQERFDGTGYPDGLAGEAIPLGARILAVVDAFSAMTDDRVYRKGRSPDEAMQELMRNAGTQFDPEVVKAFLQVWSAK